MAAFLNFLKWGPLFRQVSSTEHLTLVPFESKFINFVAYFNTSTVYLYAMWHVLLLAYDEEYMIVSICRLGVGKTTKNSINIRKDSVLWSSVTNSGGPWVGYRRGARCAGRDGEKHQVYSALNPSVVVESRVGTR